MVSLLTAASVVVVVASVVVVVVTSMVVVGGLVIGTLLDGFLLLLEVPEINQGGGDFSVT